MRLWHSALVLAAFVLVLSTVACGSTSPLLVSAENGGLSRIQDAIDATAPGGIIVIRSGTYKENLLIDRPLTLIGEDGAIVEPEDPSQPAIVVEKTEAVSIQGLTIRNAIVGIELMNSSCTILDCLIRASGTGVNSVAFEGTTVLMDHVEFRGGGTGTGVALLANCEFESFGTGASLGGAASTVIRGCSFERCFDGVVIMNTVPAV
ncbi:right-handed parallel beta-helix repeat-containing protein, partial [Candidatus Bipolaricaulota bacterium]|nr:right-handed parallel beta-helix repeat-containing protein [Candidatus Bipolaricaulota bacterium]